MNHEEQIKRLCARQNNKHMTFQRLQAGRETAIDGACVHNGVKWPEREPDHKPLSDV